MSQHPEIPGFVYDPTRNRYFKITNGDAIHNVQYHNSKVQVKKRQEQTVKRVKTMSQESRKRQQNTGAMTGAAKWSKLCYFHKEDLKWDFNPYKLNARKLGYWKYDDSLCNKLLCRNKLKLVVYKERDYMIHGLMTVCGLSYVVYSVQLSLRICKIRDFVVHGVECKEYIHYPVMGDILTWMLLCVHIEDNVTLLRLEDTYQTVKWDLASHSSLRPFARITPTCISTLLNWFVKNKCCDIVKTTCYRLSDLPNKQKMSNLAASLKSLGINLQDPVLKDSPVKYIYETVLSTDCLITLQRGSISILIGNTHHPINDKVKGIKFYDFQLENTPAGIETGQLCIVAVSDFYLMKTNIDIYQRDNSRFGIKTKVELLQLDAVSSRHSIKLIQNHVWIEMADKLAVVDLNDFLIEKMAHLMDKELLLVGAQAPQYLIQHNREGHTIYELP